MKDKADAAPDPEILSIPVNVTAAEINRQNRQWWGQTVGDEELPAAESESTESK